MVESEEDGGCIKAVRILGDPIEGYRRLEDEILSMYRVV